MATPNLESTNSSNALTTQKKNSSTALKAYGKVIISLENCLLPDEKRNETPSMKDGLSWENEMELRLIGCEFIQHAGILLRLPQVAMATGQVLFQRFYYTKSFIKQNMEVSAMACVCLASKIEESPRRPRDVCNVFHHIKQVLGGKTIAPLPLDSDYITLKNQVIKAERRVLKELGFCVHVKHPHKMIVTMLQLLESSENQVLTQQSCTTLPLFCSCWEGQVRPISGVASHSAPNDACSTVQLSTQTTVVQFMFSTFSSKKQIEDICNIVAEK
ncbi:Cyclin-L2 [Nymphon striatum]|nr:Cyclin-L2 [Nymphon striatum]